MNILPANAAHWHTIIVHFPAFALIFSLVILLLAAAMKEGRFQRIALVFLMLCAAGTFLVSRTGEKAEEIVEHMPGIEESMIHEHEEAGEVAVWVVGAVGVVALIILLTTFKEKTLSGKLVTLLVVLILAASGWLVYTAKLGGQIHHPETRPGFVVKADAEKEDLY